jgi:UDPglucose 6-dehydrogenase
MNTKVSSKEKKGLMIGFIGQGFIGKNYADDFENRGFNVIRYSRDPIYSKNKEKIKDCDIVFIAVPTPSTPKGFDDSVVRSVIKLVGKGKVAVIKSTIVPGSTESIQKENPEIFVMHSPEFLTEKTAAYDAKHPDRNIIGVPADKEIFRKKANFVLSVLPKAPYEIICSAKEAELTKYGGNCWFYFKVIYINLLYDLAEK